MDRIKTALEKSRTRKQKKPLLEPTPIKNQLEVYQPFENIEYTQTRSVEVPQAILSEKRLIAGNRTDPRAAAFRVLRTKVLQAMRENNWTSLAVTSATSNTGKSLVAANLAVSISFEVNQTVLLVDADLRKPSIHEFFDFEPDAGLLDYINGDSLLKDLFINPVFKRLVLLPGRGTTSESSELLSAPRMTNLVKELKSKYQSRIIIFDLPPLLNIDDALVFLPNVDATLLVIENGENTKSEVQNAMRLLEGSNLIGTVLNKADDDVQDYK